MLCWLTIASIASVFSLIQHRCSLWNFVILGPVRVVHTSAHGKLMRDGRSTGQDLPSGQQVCWMRTKYTSVDFSVNHAPVLFWQCGYVSHSGKRRWGDLILCWFHHFFMYTIVFWECIVLCSAHMYCEFLKNSLCFRFYCRTGPVKLQLHENAVPPLPAGEQALAHWHDVNP